MVLAGDACVWCGPGAGLVPKPSSSAGTESVKNAAMKTSGYIRKNLREFNNHMLIYGFVIKLMSGLAEEIILNDRRVLP